MDQHDHTELARYLEALDTKLADYPDVNQARALFEELDAFADAQREVAARRREVLVRMRDAGKVKDIAESLGISPARVYAILNSGS